jgi:hypothetical protein
MPTKERSNATSGGAWCGAAFDHPKFFPAKPAEVKGPAPLRTFLNQAMKVGLALTPGGCHSTGYMEHTGYHQREERGRERESYLAPCQPGTVQEPCMSGSMSTWNRVLTAK